LAAAFTALLDRNIIVRRGFAGDAILPEAHFNGELIRSDVILVRPISDCISASSRKAMFCLLGDPGSKINNVGCCATSRLLKLLIAGFIAARR